MPKPTIIIGIGTSGLRVVEQVQHFYYENTGKNKPDHVEYLYLETDENSYPGVTAEKNEIKRIYLDLRDKETMINSLAKDKNIDSSWLPPAGETGDNEAGAGGWPAFGRSALWGHQNFNQVAASISQSFQNVANYDVKDVDDSKPAVFITGSLTGGTGSGVFIDLAYMVRNLIQDIDDVFGLFLIPGGGKDGGFSGRETIYCNTYAALSSLEHFTNKKSGTKYALTYPNGSSAKSQKSPFKLTQIISQDYDSTIPSIGTLDGLYKMAGLYVFLNIYGLLEKRMRRLVDAWGNDQMGKYGSFGMSAIQYPKTQLEEFLAINLSMELLNRWINPNMFYVQGQQQQMKAMRTSIRKETFTHFETLLREAFRSLDTVEVEKGRQIGRDLERQAKIINQKEHSEESDYAYILKLFSSQQSGNYYEASQNNIGQAQDILITGIHELIVGSVDRFESLYLARMQLQLIVEAIDNCLNYWKSINISGHRSKWEEMLDQQAKWILKKRYKSVLEQNNVLYDRLKNVFTLMKMHQIAHKIVDIRKNIIEGESSIFGGSSNSIMLPRVKAIDEIISIIAKTVGKEEGRKDEKGLNILTARKAEIQNDIDDTSIPILRIYRSESFDKEVEKSNNNYRRGSNKSIPSKKDVIGDANLWTFFVHNKDTLNKKLYSECISQFERDIRRHESVENMNITEYVEKESREAQKIASRALFALIKVNPDQATKFQDHMNIPKLVIGQDQLTINKIVDKFATDSNFNEFGKDDNDVLVLDGLRNIIVFYAEKGLMNNNQLFNPTMHLRYIHDLEKLYKATPEQRNRSSREWHIIRMPYIKYNGKEAN